MDTHWYRNAVIYSLDVRTFQDSDGDGVGDFDGLASRLDYLSNLGITAIWLLPVFPSPLRDAGYDVVDYMDVDATLGGLPSFLAFLDGARERGIRVILDVPLNHTSSDHRWFAAARADRHSPYRDYYVWADERPPDSPRQIVYRGRQPDPWTYDEEAGQFYLHRFYPEEPDLNHANPKVRAEMLKILEFWLRLGVSGVRIDAAPYIAKKSAADPSLHGTHTFLRQMYERAISERPDAVLMAEADVPPAELSGYFGDGGQVQMLFDFLLNNYFFLSLAREEAEPLVKALGILPHRPRGGTWVNWVRNHDELDLERLTRRERDDVMRAFAPDETMRIYGRGIRRRLPPMMDGDDRRIEMTYSLLFALPGTPILRYGEEIAMGDDLSLPGRDAVRTPMQWTPERNGGFSVAERERLVFPPIEEGPYGYRERSVSQQQIARDSFLARMQLLIGVRRQTPEIGWGEPRVVATDDPHVLGLRYAGDPEVVVLHNLGGSASRVRLEELAGHAFLYDIHADRRYDAPGEDWEVGLEPYGYRWLRAREAPVPKRTESAGAATDAIRDRPR